jgi:hypothetical protein
MAPGARVTRVLFRRPASLSAGGEWKVWGARSNSPQKEAAGAADAGLMQIEWGAANGLKLMGVGTEVGEGL